MQWKFDESQEDSVLNEYEKDYDMDERHMDIIKRLKEIGIRDDYYGIVEDEFLEEISELPFLTVKQRSIIYDDINNQREGFCFFQDNTNELLRRLLSKDDGILGIPL